MLPSMRRTQLYRARILLRREGFVEVAYCVCTAGLAGCCNHIAALLYALEEFVRITILVYARNLRYPPRISALGTVHGKKKVAPSKIEDVRLFRAKFMFGTYKRSRGQRPCTTGTLFHQNKRLANPIPTDVEEMMQALQVAHAHALAEDKSGTVALYGPSTWRRLAALSLERAGVEASDTDSSSSTSSSTSSTSSTSSDDDDDQRMTTTLPSTMAVLTPHWSSLHRCSLPRPTALLLP